MTSAVEELENAVSLCGRIRWTSQPERIAESVLAPLAGFLAADTASFRSLGVTDGEPAPLSAVGFEIPDSVQDAYLSRYFRLDPARRLLGRSVREPLFAHPTRGGEWLNERASPAERARRRSEFLRYRREFLLPNHFYHHLGFCFQDLHGNTLLFDFHRPARSTAFGRLEQARANVLAMYLQAQAVRCTHADAYRATSSAALSVRELEVAEAVARGLSNKEVAASLGISVRTVENHMRSIFAKLEVTTRTRLAAKLRAAAVLSG